MNIGLKYKKEMLHIRKQFQEVRMDLVKQEFLIRKLIDMFKDQEILISHVRTRVRVGWKGELSLEEVAGVQARLSKFEEKVNDMGT